ncbi:MULTISPECIES: hypothetical protein [unclassified Streptomyces]
MVEPPLGNERVTVAGDRAEELLQGGHEVTGEQIVRAEPRQHLGDLR